VSRDRRPLPQVTRRRADVWCAAGGDGAEAVPAVAQSLAPVVTGGRCGRRFITGRSPRFCDEAIGGAQLPSETPNRSAFLRVTAARPTFLKILRTRRLTGMMASPRGWWIAALSAIDSACNQSTKALYRAHHRALIGTRAASSVSSPGG
jgi:hypothetical protein